MVGTKVKRGAPLFPKVSLCSVGNIDFVVHSVRESERQKIETLLVDRFKEIGIDPYAIGENHVTMKCYGGSGPNAERKEYFYESFLLLRITRLWDGKKLSYKFSCDEASQ